MPEGIETVTITPILNVESACIASLAKPFTIYIQDVIPLTVVASMDSTIICPNYFSTIDATASGAVPGYTYTWDNGIGVGKKHIVSPSVTTTYTVMATDSCGTHMATDNVTIFVNTYTPLQVVASSDVDIYCPFDQTVISAAASGGASFYTYTWDNNAGNQSTETVAPVTTTEYVITVHDTCGSVATDTVKVNLVNYIPLKIKSSNDTNVCKNEAILLYAKARDGHAPYTYNWENGVPGDTAFIAQSEVNTKYVVAVTDNCGYTEHDTVLVTISLPQANFTQEFLSNIFVQFKDSSVSDSAIVDYKWDFGDSFNATTNNPTHEYVDALPHDVKLRITNKIGCEDSIVKTIYPPLSIYMPTAFTPNDDGLNDYFQAIGFGVQKFTLFIYNRWGLLIYKSSDEKEKWEAKGVPDGVYVYKIICEGYDGNILRKTGTITILH